MKLTTDGYILWHYQLDQLEEKGYDDDLEVSDNPTILKVFLDRETANAALQEARLKWVQDNRFNLHKIYLCETVYQTRRSLMGYPNNAEDLSDESLIELLLRRTQNVLPFITYQEIIR